MESHREGLISQTPQLFFVAILPDEQIQQEVTAFKLAAAEQFGSRHALKSPPHITLIPPFKWSADEMPVIQESLTAAASQLAPFPIHLQNFDHFGQRVIFVDVKTDESLVNCYQLTANVFHQHLGITPDTRPFHAHMTVAFKDLQRKVFRDAWAYFSQQPYDRTFTAHALTLLKHTGQKWEVLETGLMNNER
ncbi:2'-5' RNA ligase family protein [Nibrella saemangeumensis]|uniref:2'-5' RNA ligase family protein n=1 Tax=Nibrella saemangeumensis TaxID=1084526 RepID=A0ABP8N7S3_9BACT